MPLLGSLLNPFRTVQGHRKAKKGAARKQEESKSPKSIHNEDDRDEASSTKEPVEEEIVFENVHIQNEGESKFEFTNLKSAFSDNAGVIKKKALDDCSGSISNVSFGSIQIREYERVIDSTAIYMGLALGWGYNESAPTPVRPVQEKSKSLTAKYSNTSHGGGDESRMKRTNGSDRYGMLIRYGYEAKELKKATKEAAEFYKQRQREAARSLVVADARNHAQKCGKPQTRTLRRSMFG